MSDLISRQMAIDAAMQNVSDKRSHDFNAGATRAANQILRLPTVKAIPIEDIQRLYNAAVAYRDRFKPYSDNWITANDQAIGVRSVLDMWENY